MDEQRSASNPGELRLDAAALGLECSECRLQLEPDLQLCAHCDTRLKAVCPRCGVPLPPAAFAALRALRTDTPARARGA